jgi:hypothetical protein
MKNDSIGQENTWSKDGYVFREAICQEYSNCKFSGGFVGGHPVDTMYIQLEKDGVVTTSLLLRPDEVAAIAWIASGLLWSGAIADVPETSAFAT